ncbi:MAG: hypothetical protein EHM41_01090 [Chloroflexi bacterium]|nr:MAG: hypothetical protein EHM41_01090 [Chloroflexota bacterium]
MRFASLIKLTGVCLVLFACSQADPLGTPTPAVRIEQPVETEITDTPDVEPSATVEVLPTITPTPVPSLWIQPFIPEQLKTSIHLPEGIRQVQSSLEANLRLEVSDANPASRWIYAAVAPFPTLVEGVAFEDVLGTWKGESSGPFSGAPLMVSEDTREVLSAVWGEPAAGFVQVFPEDELDEAAWNERPSWAVVPFEALDPRWKVLEVDGFSPLRKDFDAAAYPLTVPISLVGDVSLQEQVNLELAIPASNRDPSKLTTVMLTGVTALVRGTSNTMYSRGVTYPAEEIGFVLQDADILHVSNEIPFFADCPLYELNFPELRFCTNPRYIGLLEEIGTDVIELTGDHFADWGDEATLYTLELYNERGWPYYGGGANLEDARRPVMIEHNGNRIAFIGCNAKGGGYATASNTRPGAGECDWEWMETEVNRLKQEGYQVIATFQHQEYYEYQVREQYRCDFLRLAEAGASIVSGSQAHMPHGFEFSGSSFIHYGLGNLFFDQYNSMPGTNDAFLDRHVFYDGRYLGAELLAIRFIDYAKPVFMTAEERQTLLEIVFSASGW